MRFGVLVYEGVEPVDLATYGVLSMARRVVPAISMFSVAPAAGVVTLANGLRVIADHGYADCPVFDVLIVTGGPGWSRQCEDGATLAFVREAARERIVAGVCTGAMILAAAGVLDGHKATTKCEVTGDERPPTTLMRERHGRIEVVDGVSVVDGGSVVTGGGVTLGIDATLYLLARLMGERVANETARIMEYSRAWQANREAMPVVVS